MENVSSVRASGSAPGFVWNPLLGMKVELRFGEAFIPGSQRRLAHVVGLLAWSLASISRRTLLAIRFSALSRRRPLMGRLHLSFALRFG